MIGCWVQVHYVAHEEDGVGCIEVLHQLISSGAHREIACGIEGNFGQDVSSKRRLVRATMGQRVFRSERG